MSNIDIIDRYVGGYMNPELSDDAWRKYSHNLRDEFYDSRSADETWMNTIIRPALGLVSELRSIGKASIETINDTEEGQDGTQQ